MEYNWNGILFSMSCESVSSPTGFRNFKKNSVERPAEFHGTE